MLMPDRLDYDLSDLRPEKGVSQDLEALIAGRRKQAADRELFVKAYTIGKYLGGLGSDRTYAGGDLNVRLKTEHVREEATEISSECEYTRADVSVTYQGKTVFDANAREGNGIRAYVPGAWEALLDSAYLRAKRIEKKTIAEKREAARAREEADQKRRDDTARSQWGL
jgi:hypothetical protein